MFSIQERGKDVILIAECVINAEESFRSFRIAGKPQLYSSTQSGPVWLLPIDNPAAEKTWDKKYCMFYYPCGGVIFFRPRYGVNLPSDMSDENVIPFEEGITYNTYRNIYELHSDDEGQYVKISYKQALLNEEMACHDFRSEYYIDHGFILKSVKLIEIQDCILRWIATMQTQKGELFRVSVDPLGHSYISEYLNETADFVGQEPSENKTYFSINTAHKDPFCSDHISMKYRNGAIEILPFSSAEQKPPAKIFKGVRIEI